jgi:hypothetical protein
MSNKNKLSFFCVNLQSPVSSRLFPALDAALGTEKEERKGKRSEGKMLVYRTNFAHPNTL